MGSMGFVRSERRHGAIVAEKDVYMSFDSGLKLSFAEACHNNIVLGSTGSGKTSSAVLQVAASHLKAGHAGLAIDIKGNFSGQLRCLAKNRGREDDIVEFGTFDSAMRVNLLEGMNQTEVTDLLRLLAMSQFSAQSHNLEWCLKGVRIAADCMELLGYIKEEHPTMPVGLSALVKILNDYRFAARLFGFFMECVFDARNPAHAAFADRIKSEHFHVLSYDAKKKDNTNFAEQTTWRLQGIRSGLTEFMDAPGVAANFAAPGACGIDLERLIYEEKKVVLLRFGVATGSVGSWIARHVLERFYKAVYANGLKLAKDEYVFFIGDEFQDFINLSAGNRMNDNSFTAKAREFRVAQCVATQSLSALTSRGASYSAVMEYVNNFSNRVIMYCDDPHTQTMSERYEPDIALNKLGPGECVLTRFDLTTRRHEHSRERLQLAHDSLQGELRQTGGEVVVSGPGAGYAPPEAEADLMDIFGLIEAEKKALREEDKLAGGKFDESQSEEAPRRRKRLGERIRRDEAENAAAENDDAATGVEAVPDALREIVGKYPEFFPKIDGKNLKIPLGWIAALDKALEAMRQIGLPLDIQVLRLRSGGSLGVSNAANAYNTDMATRLCNKLLEVTTEICPICGKRIEQPDMVECGFCRDCLGRHELLPLHKAKREEDGSVFFGLQDVREP